VRNTLLEIGGWLKQNGEAIYDTTPWKVYGEGPTKVKAGFGHDKDTQPYTSEDFRFTQKGISLYVIGMVWPADGRAVIHALGAAQQARGLRITGIDQLGSNAKIEYRQTDDALEIKLPGQALNKYAYVLRIQMASPLG
jgi:alpha-L-fucosidase